MLGLKTVTSLAAAAFALLPLSLQAAPLSVVNVNAPAVNCVFNVTCVVTVTDSIGTFTPPGDNGTARLQSRTYPGTVPAPAGGKLAYIYRVDLTQVKGLTGSNCVTKMDIDFGVLSKEPYKAGGNQQIFVITSGGLGSVGIASATQVGSAVALNFSDGGVCPGATSYFFGMTAPDIPPKTPVTGVATLYFSLGGSAPVAARLP